MKISLADSTFKPQVKQLWHDCFGDDDPYLSWYFDNIYKDENTVVAHENGRLLGATQLRPHKIVIGGKIYNCSYVCGVSTQPDVRGRKIGSAIMEKTAEIAKSRGGEFNVLVPIIDGFYEKNGYARCFERTEYFFDINKTLRYLEHGKSKFADCTDEKRLLEIYEEFCLGYDCYMLRDNNYFRQLTDQYNACGGGCVMFESGGYMLFYAEKGELRIEEAIALNKNAAEDILAKIPVIGKNCEKVILRCGEKDVFSVILNTLDVKCHKTHNVSVQPFYMTENELLVKCGKIDMRLAKLLNLNTDGVNNYSKSFVNILL